MKLLQWIPIYLFLFACSEDDQVQLTKTEMLAGETSRSWKITALVPDDESCPGVGVVLSDNIFTFHRNGDFSHDNGTVTDDQECGGDIRSMSGTWELNNDETILHAWVNTGNENPEFAIQDFFDDSMLEELTPTKMVIKGTDSHDPVTITFSPI